MPQSQDNKSIDALKAAIDDQIAVARELARFEEKRVELEREHIELNRLIDEKNEDRLKRIVAVANKITAMAESQTEIIRLLDKLPLFVDDITDILALILQGTQQLLYYVISQGGGASAEAKRIKADLDEAIEEKTLESYRRQLQNTVARLNVVRERMAKKGEDVSLDLVLEVEELEKRRDDITKKLGLG